MIALVDPLGRGLLGAIHVKPADEDKELTYNVREKRPSSLDTDAWREYAETTARERAEEYADQVMDASGWTGRCSREELVEELRMEWLRLQAQPVLNLKNFL